MRTYYRGYWLIEAEGGVDIHTNTYEWIDHEETVEDAHRTIDGWLLAQ